MTWNGGCCSTEVLEALLKWFSVELTSHQTCEKAPMEPLVREPLLKATESGPSRRVKDAPAWTELTENLPEEAAEIVHSSWSCGVWWNKIVHTNTTATRAYPCEGNSIWFAMLGHFFSGLASLDVPCSSLKAVLYLFFTIYSMIFIVFRLVWASLWSRPLKIVILASPLKLILSMFWFLSPAKTPPK